ncbi:MAG: shikimate kinase [Actinobacteria bacterium]|nr:shikimate kinase [Actinomycetota bacterium]MCG2802130.1 shikimate kinase [Cellulomonas sp.]
MSHPDAIALVGPPGSGAAQVAAILAERWGLPLVDTDALIEARTGRTAADILVEDGEAQLRLAEREATTSALGARAGIVALSSGSVEDEQVRADLADWVRGGAPVVLLDLQPTTAARRAGLHAGTTALVGTRSRWRALFDARHPLYVEVATVVIEVDDVDDDGAADAVATALTAPGR